MMRLSIVLSSVLLLSLPVASFAQDTSTPSIDKLSKPKQQELLNLIELAEARFKAKDFPKALGYFNDAYAIYPHPRLLYKIASVQDAMGNAKDAFESYELFIQRQPNAKEAPKASARVKALRQELETAFATLRILSDPKGAVVFLDSERSRPKGTTPTVELPVQPGDVTVIVKKEGYKTLTTSLSVKPGEHISKQFDLEEDQSYVALDQPLATEETNTWLWIMAATAGVGVIGTGTFGYLWSQGEDGAESTQTYETLTYLSGGVAILGLMGTLYFWLDDDQGVRKGQAQGLMPYVSQEGAGAVWQMRF